MGATGTAPADLIPPPTGAVGAFVIEAFLAQGGCGVVFTARHRDTGAPAALKVLQPQFASSPKMVERFLREVEIIDRLQHPNIVEVLERGRLPDGRPFFAMELLEDGVLADHLRAHGRMSVDEAVAVLSPICSALTAAHEVGVIHRDIKASNIGFTRGPAGRVAKLLDFGVAKLTETEGRGGGLTSFGRQVGTPHAMAPEQIRCEAIDARTDVYALGVLLFQMLVGRPPFVSDDPLELELAQLQAPPPRPSDLAPVARAVDAIVLRCLEKEPERRFQSVAEVVAALRAAVGQPSTPRSPTPAADRGVAVYLEVTMTADESDVDDALVDDLGRILDLGEERLRAGGFALALQLGTSLLGVQRLPEDADASRRLRREAVSCTIELRDALSGRAGADPRLGFCLTVHSDRVVLSDRADPARGPLVETDVWVARGAEGSALATPEVLEDLVEYAACPRAGRHVQL